MTALTQHYYTQAAVLVGEPSEALLPNSITLGPVLCGTATDAVGAVIPTLEDVIHPHWVSAKRLVAAIFKVVITCPSGVIGALVTEP